MGIKHPIINLQVSFKTECSLRVCVPLSHVGDEYSAAVKHKPSADVT